MAPSQGRQEKDKVGAMALLPTQRLEKIVAFLQQKLRGYGIALRTGYKDGRLLLLFEGKRVPPRDRMVALARQLTAYFQDEPLTSLEVCGRAMGERALAWHARLPLQSGNRDLDSWLASIAVSTSALARPAAPQPQQGQRFLRFRFGTQESALLPADYIREVLGIWAERILPVPHVSPSVLGIHNWRGQMLWLVDLAHLLGFDGGTGAAAETIDIIVLEVEKRLLGLAVRKVDNLEEHDWQKLQPPTGLFPPAMLAYVEGYLTEAESTILSAPALVHSPLWRPSDRLSSRI